jgi:curli biogenesis system outer membrane secretion channel CsgG
MNKRNLFLTVALMMSMAIPAVASAGSKKAVNPMNPRNAMVLGSAPENNVTATQNGFVCFANYLAKDPRRPVFSVGRLRDDSGKFSNFANEPGSAGGYEMTQGLSNMVYTALGKLAPDFAIVERTDTAIVDSEISLAKESLLGDPSEQGTWAVDKNGQKILLGKGLRSLTGGQFQGVDYYITGAITEINYNISSGGAQLKVQGIGGGNRVYSMSIAMDLRIVDARTLRVVKTVSERKKISGNETEFGVFNFLGDYLIDINAGRKLQEPIQLGVRATMESALLKLVGAAYGTNYGETCSSYAATTYGQVVPVTTPVADNTADPIADKLSASK